MLPTGPHLGNASENESASCVARSVLQPRQGQAAGIEKVDALGATRNRPGHWTNKAIVCREGDNARRALQVLFLNRSQQRSPKLNDGNETFNTQPFSNSNRIEMGYSDVSDLTFSAR